MVTFELPATTPPMECLAWDEALLDAVEEEACEAALWFWESPIPCVVVGYGQTPEREVHMEACRADDVPVLRRCSGGGTVVQGPGCLSYALALPIDSAPALATVSGTNAHVMARQRDALARIVEGTVVVRGHTDLVWNGRKVSGNAQRRKRRALLFHGTFLHGFDLARVTRWLRAPSSEPAYREGRAHEAFISNVPCPARLICKALADEWQAMPAAVPRDASIRVKHLLEERYARAEWHARRAS